ncbi:MAG: EamA family transporter [Chloroflexi bacterium]|nr:EamA family transporter [Chloroflexota bacterium]
MKTIQVFVGSRGGIWLGYAAAIGAAIAYGASQTVGKHVTSEYAPPLVGTAFSLLFGFVYVSIMFHRHIPNDLRTSSRRGFLWFGLSGIASASGVTLLYFALSNAPLVVVSPVVAINPLITLTLAHFFLHKLEKISRMTIMGTVLVVLGVVIITVSKAVS